MHTKKINKAIIILTTIILLTNLLTHPAAPAIPNNPTFAKLAATTPEDDPFARLTLEAARRYKQSSDEKKEEPKPEEPAPTAPQAEPEKPAQKGWFDFLRKDDTPKSDPILAKHKKFSDDWWNALFVPCKGCEKKDADKKIDCEKLLAQNPPWEEVKPMSRQAKDIITQRALRQFADMDDPCIFACAICSGGNPNTRLNGNRPHTALHVSIGKGYGGADGVKSSRHYGIFNLLLRQGADVNLKCINLHPLDFEFPDSWNDELRAHGAKLSEEKDDN